jgi:hypothetical protein
LDEKFGVQYIKSYDLRTALITTGKITSVNGSIVKTQIVGDKGFNNTATFNI